MVPLAGYGSSNAEEYVTNGKVRLLCVGYDLSGGGAERGQLTLLETLMMITDAAEYEHRRVAFWFIIERERL